MKRKITWPQNFSFAFTVVDDTDGATVKNVKPVYDYLYSKGILTTKTVWVFPPKDDRYTGECLTDGSGYLEFIKDLKSKGFEIAFHNAASGGNTREETEEAFKIFKNELSVYPNMHINHANNVENIYWGYKRFSGPVRFIYKHLKKGVSSLGDDERSEYFWGDLCKNNIKYIRNRTFNGINTLKEDTRVVYKETGKGKYSNYWFSSTDGMRLNATLKVLTKENIDKLEKEHGLCILYTHFAYDFVDENGNLSEDFKKAIDYLAAKNCWFAPASTILDWCLKDKEYKPSKLHEFLMDIKWFFERIKKG